VNVSDILLEFTDHGFGDISTVRQMAILNETYNDVIGREPWPFLEKTIDLTFDGTNRTASNMPSDFRSALKLINKASGRRLVAWREDDFMEQYQAVLNQTETPYLFFFQGLSLNVHPIPASSDVVTMRYLAKPVDLLSTDVEATILLPSRYHRATLVNGSLEKLYAMEDDTDLAAWFERKYEKAVQLMRQDLWKQQWDSPDYIHHTDPDDLWSDF
jgi:hypothetical protein